MEEKQNKSIMTRLRGGIAFLTMKFLTFAGRIHDRIISRKNAEEPKIITRDTASAVITAAMLLIILVLFIVASVKLGLTFSSIWNDFKTFFYGT